MCYDCCFCSGTNVRLLSSLIIWRKGQFMPLSPYRSAFFLRLFRPLTSFLSLRPFTPPLGLSLLPSIPVVFIFRPLPIQFLHRFQPIPSPARPLKSTSSRPGSHPSRRHPPVLSSSSEFLSLSTSAALRGRLPSPHRLSLRRLVAIARACPRLRLHVPVGLGHDGRPCRALYAVCA